MPRDVERAYSGAGDAVGRLNVIRGVFDEGDENARDDYSFWDVTVENGALVFYNCTGSRERYVYEGHVFREVR